MPLLRLVPLFLLVLFIGCPSAGDPTPADDDDSTDDDVFTCEGVTPEVTDLSPDDLAGMLDAKDFQFLNVHIPYAGEIPATDAHVSYTDIPAIEDALGNDPAAKVVVYCRTGPMSEAAAADLIDLGYCRVFDLPGGMVAWEAAGYTIDP